MPLTKEDIEFLIDCVTAKESCLYQGDMLSDLMEAIVLKKDQQPEDFEKRQREKQRVREKSRMPIRDRCILLKAKLIQMRDGLDADDLLNDVWKEKQT